MVEDIIKKVITESSVGAEFYDTAKIISINNVLVVTTPLNGVFLNEIILFDDKHEGIVMSFNEYSVSILPLFDVSIINPNSDIRKTNQIKQIQMYRNFSGRILNGLGIPIDQKDDIMGESISIFSKLLTFRQRNSIHKQMITGIKILDWMIPLGYGQKEAIIGNIGQKKTTLIGGIIKNIGKDTKTISIYVSLGQKKTATLSLYESIIKDKIGNCIFIITDFSDPIGHMYLAPFVANAIGEYYRDNGYNVVIFLDSLTQHAAAYREIALTLGLTPSRDAYPPDIVSLYACLLEKASCLHPAEGGGSLSIFPVVDTINHDIVNTLVTYIISITDGQIVLKNSAIDLSTSVSRVGNVIQHPLLRKYSSNLKLLLLRYQEYKQLLTIISDPSKEIKDIVHKGDMLIEVLRQDFKHPLSLVKQIVLSRCIYEGLIDKCNLDLVQMLRDYIDKLDDNAIKPEDEDRIYTKLVEYVGLQK